MPRYRVVFPPCATKDPDHRELSIHVHGLDPEIRMIDVSQGKPEIFAANRGDWVSLRVVDIDVFGLRHHPGPPCHFTAGREPAPIGGVLGVAIETEEPEESTGEPEREAVVQWPSPKGQRIRSFDPSKEQAPNEPSA
jgi:hypothetical protein